jgi:quinol monooxygenase YgiN
MTFIWIIQGTVAEEHVDAVKAALLKLAPHGRMAPGSIRYEYFQAKEEPTQFMHFSIWESEADKDRFNASAPHAEMSNSLPEGAWTVPPNPTVLRSLEDVK